MDVPDGFMESAFKALVALLFGIGGWLWTQLIKAVGRNRDDLQTQKDALAEHKLYASNNYATKVDMKETMGEIRNTMTRMHERVDGIYELLNERAVK